MAGPDPGWQLVGNPNQIAMALDATRPKEGKTCLYIQNRLGKRRGGRQSDPFTTPPTGQLGMTVWLRGDNLAQTSELRIVFESDRAERSIGDSSRSAACGRARSI